MPGKKPVKKTAKKKGNAKKKMPEQAGRGFVLTVIIILALIVLGYLVLDSLKEEPITPEKVVEEELNETGAYEYNGFSFIYRDGFWYSDVYINMQAVDLRLYFGPRELEDIEINYFNNTFSKLLWDKRRVVISVQPDAPSPQYNGIAAASLADALNRVYFTKSTAACQYPGEGCEDRPIVTCMNESIGVIEIHERPGDINITYEKNCLTIAAEGEDLVKAANKVLLGWYGIIRR